MSAVTAEFLQTAWKGIDARHLARSLNGYVGGVNFMGSTKADIIQAIATREYRTPPVTVEDALRIAEDARVRQQKYREKLERKRAEEAQIAGREKRLRALQKQALDYLAAHPECPLSLDAALIGDHCLFNVWVSHEVFHAHLLRLHEALPGFIFSAQAGTWVDLYFPPGKLDTVVELFSDMHKEVPNG